VSGFPPEDIRSFLAFSAGEWLTLRSRFAIHEGEEGENGDEWHRSERGELRVSYLEPAGAGDDPGGLEVTPPEGSAQRLIFREGGRCEAGDRQGSWRLWPDGSLELHFRHGTGEVRERIWYTKPNLRLRSSVERRADGSPGRASFSSEIRRVGRPATDG
jgi:hypothetical protein